MPDSTVTIQELLAHHAWVRALARRLVLDASDADEIEQAAWAAAIERPPRHRGNLRGWLGRLVRRRRADLHRAESRRVARERRAQAGIEATGPEELLVRGELRARLAREVLRLEEPYRSTVLLRFYEDVELEEVARLQGVPVTTVRTRQRRALQQLRDRLRGPRGDMLSVLAPIFAVPSTVIHKPGVGVLMAVSKSNLWTGVIVLTALIVASVAWFSRETGETAPEAVAGSAEDVADDASGESPRLRGGTIASEASSKAANDSHESGGRWDVREGEVLVEDMIAGVVRDVEGRPLSRVAAMLLAEEGVAESRLVTSDSAGRFQFDGVDETSRVLRLNYGRAEWRRRVQPGERMLEVVLSLDPQYPRGVETRRAAARGEIGGTVYDAAGEKLVRCEVRLLDKGGRNVLRTTHTDDSGEFSFEGLDPGIHALLFAADAAPHLFTRVRVGKWLSATLRTPLPIAGVVVAAETGDPIPGLRVTVIQDEAKSAARRHTQTGEDGEFSLRVPAGEWRLQIGRKSARVIAGSPDWEVVPKEVEPVAAGSIGLRIVVEASVSISGSLRGPDGSPWTTGALVRATPITSEGRTEYDGVRIVAANADGSFRIPGLSRRAHDVTVTPAPRGDAAFGHVQRVSGGSTGLIVQLREGRPITLRLVDSSGSSVEPVGGWIQVRPSGSDPGGPQAVSAKRREDGSFVTPALDPSLSYLVVAGGFRGYVGGETTRVSAGDTDVAVRLGGVRLAGRLRDAAGEPVAGARVEVWAVDADVPTHAWMTTNADGAFSIPGAPEGEVRVVAVVRGEQVALGKHTTPTEGLELRTP